MIAALFTMTSRWPCSSTVASTRASTSALLGDVEQSTLRHAARVRDERGRLLRAGLVDVGAHDSGTRLGEAGGDGTSDAAAGPGHDGDRSGEVERFGDGGHDAEA